MFKYIVQPTDTLYFIALKFNIPVKELIYANNLTDPNEIYPGQSLVIPNSQNIGQNKMPQLYPGCTDDPFIILLQSQLAKLGYYNDNIDGLFNSMTHKAVLSFQMDNGLEPSGFVDQKTWTKLFESTKISYDLPNYKAHLINPGVLMILSTDKKSYNPNDIVALTLFIINLTAKPLIFTYGTNQRYDFVINDSRGEILWQWSYNQSFHRVPGSMCLPPYKTISHTKYIELSHILDFNTPKKLRAMGWNTSFQTYTNKIELPLTIKP